MLKKILKSAAVLVAGTAGGQLFVLAISPVLTRIYSPSDFGVFGIYAAILYMVLSFSSLRYEVAIPLVRSDEDARYLTAAALLVVLCITTLLIPISELLFWSFKHPHDYQTFTWLLPIGVVTAGIYNVFTYVRLRNTDHNVIARTRALQSIGGGIFQIVYGFLSGGALGLIIGQIVGVSLGVSKLSNSSFISTIKLTREREKLFGQLREQKNFALYDAPAALLAVGNTHAPVLVMATLFSPAAAGMYALAQRIFVAPLGLISAAFSASLVSLGREINADGKEIVGGDHLLTFRAIGPIATISALVSFYFFDSIFGKQWIAAGPVAACVALFVGQKCAFDSIFSIYAIQGRQRAGFFSQLTVFLTRFSILLVSSNFFSLEISVGIFSLASTLSYFLGMRAIIDRNDISRASWAWCFIDVIAPYALIAGLMFFSPVPSEVVLLIAVYCLWCAARIISAILNIKRR